LSLPFKLEFSPRFGAGAELIYSWQTVEPTPFNTTTSVSGQPGRRHFLGGNERIESPGRVNPGSGWSVLRPNQQTDILFVVGAQLKATIGKDSGIGIGGSGAGVLELGPPAASSDRGIRIKMNQSGEGAPLVEVVGALTGGFDWKINLVCLQYSGRHRWDILPFQWQFGTEPFHAIYPIPLPTVVTPKTAPAAVWVGGANRLVDDFYEGGALDLSHGPAPALVYTETNPETGAMNLMLSTYGPEGYSTPSLVAETTGAISTAAARLPASMAPFGWIVVWSEIAAEDLGNPMAQSTLRYSISTDAQGADWNPPRQLAATGRMALKLDLQRTANRLFLFWMEPEESLLSDRRRIMISSSTTLNNWTAPQVAFSANNALVDFQFTTSASFTNFRFAFAGRHRDGWILAGENIGGQWQGPLQPVAERGSKIPALFYDSGGALWKAEFVPSAHAIVVSQREETNWIERLRIDERATVENLVAVPLLHLGREIIALAWLEEGTISELWHAWLATDGTLLAEPNIAQSESSGSVLHFALAPASNVSGGATLVYQLSEGASSSIRTVPLHPDDQTAATLHVHYDPVFGRITISWPALFQAFLLEHTRSLSAPLWQPVFEVQTVGEMSYIEIEPEFSQQFFRLRRHLTP
jgi:hypothetical protein